VYQKQVVREEDDEEKVEEVRDISMTDNPRLYGYGCMDGYLSALGQDTYRRATASKEMIRSKS
jgi:hypothetical protein